MKKTAILIIFCLSTLLFGQRIQNLDSAIVLEDYQYRLSDSLEQGLEDFRDWETLTPPTLIPQSQSGGQRVLWVRSSFTPAPLLKSQTITVNIGRIKGSVEFWLNGEKLKSIGLMGEDFSFPKYTDSTLQIPAQLIKWGESNTLYVKYYSPVGDFNALFPWNLSSYQQSYKLQILADIMNADVYLAFGLLSFFIALYFFLQYLYNRKNRSALWFSLANLALGIYFNEMGIRVDLLNPLLNFVIAKACMSLFFLFLTLYILDYFRIFNIRWIKWALVGTQSLIVLLYIISGRDFTSSMNIFTLGLMPASIWLIFIAVIMVKAITQKNKEAVIVGIGVAFGLLAAVYDFVFTFKGATPLFWLQGPGIVVFDVSIFITQALSGIRTNRALEIHTAEMEEQKEGLTALINEINRSSSVLSSISQNLDDNIQRSVKGMETLSQNSSQMSAQVEEQFALTESAGNNVSHLLESSSVVFDRLAHQAEEISSTGKTLEEMLKEMDHVTTGLQNISQSGTELEQLATEGEAAMQISSKSMKEIRDVSAKVYQVVDAMNDLADRTNLLSMNASIEAAHAGNSGRGFAVVAQEIKKLAEGSSQRAGEVIQEIDLIREKIEDGVDINQRVNTSLHTITSRTRSTIEDIASLYQSMNSQRQASKTIMQSLNSLTSDGESLHEKTGLQQQMSQQLDQGIKSLIQSFKEMNQGVQQIFGEMQTLTQATEGVQELSKQARDEAMTLASLTD